LTKKGRLRRLLRRTPQEPLDRKGGLWMSQEHIELRAASVAELRRVDRILSELARPTLDEESITPQTRAAMVQVGIVVSGRASRKDLIDRLWSRKRSLRRQVGSLGDWGPMQPVA
jgi:hypothetical protein